MVGLRFSGRLAGIEVRRLDMLPYKDNEGTVVHWFRNPAAENAQFFVSPEMFDRLATGTEPLRERFVD